MPFTPSHAVVALPFLRTPLIPAAIAVGAMTPDLPLFVRALPLHYGLTHSLSWLPLTIVLALALLVVWRALLRPAVRELSPTWLARRLPAQWDDGARAALHETFAGGRAGTSWPGVLLLVASLAIGTLSHIAWDVFTHEGRWGVELLPMLGEEWGALPGYRWLQHVSSAVGLVILCVWAVRWLRRRPNDRAPSRVLPDAVRWAWWLALPVLLLAAWLVGGAIFGPLTAEWTIAHLAYRVLPPACAVWGLVTVTLAVAIQLVRRHRAHRSGDPQLPGDGTGRPARIE